MADAEAARSALRQGARPIGGRLVICLGLSQLVGWGTMHYLIAVFGSAMAAHLGWSLASIQAGFSFALLGMGLSSTLVGRWIDAKGGRSAMMAGCWLGAIGCALLATVQGGWQYFGAWLLIGLAMRLSLYDAAFATLAHLGGAASKRAMSQITLFGGLASTVFWPLGQWLSSSIGWRAALLVYALLLVLTPVLHLALPRGHRRSAIDGPQAAGAPDASRAPTAPSAPSTPSTPEAFGAADTRVARPTHAGPIDKGLYAAVAIIVVFMQTGMAAHLIDLLRGFGWDSALAVSLSSLLGLGQLTGRGWVVLAGHRIDAIRLNLVPSALLCGSFVIALAAGTTVVGAALFAFLYGAGNGIATITRGAMPLLLFETARYGRIVGAILKPAFMLAAAAPVAFAFAIERWGQRPTMSLLLLMGAALMAASVALVVRRQRRR